MELKPKKKEAHTLREIESYHSIRISLFKDIHKTIPIVAQSQSGAIIFGKYLIKTIRDCWFGKLRVALSSFFIIYFSSVDESPEAVGRSMVSAPWGFASVALFICLN